MDTLSTRASTVTGHNPRNLPSSLDPKHPPGLFEAGGEGDRIAGTLRLSEY